VSDDSGFDAETAGFVSYTLAGSSTGGAEEPSVTAYETAIPEGSAGPSADENPSEYARRMGAERTAESAASFKDYGPVGRSAGDPISSWDMPPDFTDAERAAFQSAITKRDGETTWEESAAYNRAAGHNLGTQGKAGMDTVEAFESQAQMYTQVDDV
jgi:hypothetical protein